MLHFQLAALALLAGIVVSTNSGSNSSVFALPSSTQKAEAANLNPSTSTSLPQSKQTQRSTLVSQTSGRTAYKPISLADISSPLTGKDPKTVAVQAFGFTEPEGPERGTERVEVTRPRSNKAVVIITQIGLPDDSVAAIRYRVELTRTGQEWKIVWAGSQVKCRSGRGHQNWSSEICR